MYRILRADKDTYIQNKYVKGFRSTDANVGQAGTIDIYKLYDETVVSGSSSGIELSRALLHFDLNPLRALTGSFLNLADTRTRCYINLRDIYGGQTVPSNFTLAIFPLAQAFDEGRGSDVIAYRDIDATNWVTGSISSGTVRLWNISGSVASGTLGSPNLDYYVSGNLGSGVVALGVTQSFARGDEDLLMDVTALVSGTITGFLPDYGFRLSFVETQETDTITRFVKRFATRHVRDPFIRPTIILKADDSVRDTQAAAFFDVANQIGVYNTYFGQFRNFFSGSTAITGSNSLMLTLVSSHSNTYFTSSWSTTHSASITYLTSSYVYFSMSFT